MKKVKAAILPTIILAMIGALVFFQRAIDRLGIENAELRAKLSMSEVAATPSSPPPDVNESPRSVSNANEMATRVDGSELPRLRAEVTRLRSENDKLKRLLKETDRTSHDDQEPKPAFQHGFLSRTTWTNSGYA